MLTQPKFQCVDLFCGEQSVSHAFSNEGYEVAAHDILLTEDDELWLQYIWHSFWINKYGHTAFRYI